MGIKSIFFRSNQPIDEKPNKPVAGETTHDVDLNLNGYVVYSSENLNFRFVIADITFKSNDKKAVNFDMSKLETNELIQLNNVNKYLNLLQNAGYSIAKLDVASDVISATDEARVKLFIPVTKTGDSIVLNNLNNSKQITIDLTKNSGNIEDFKNTSGEIISSDSYDIFVSNAYISTTMYHNEEIYNYPSVVKVYTFKLEVKNLEKNNVVIEEAYFIPEGSDESFSALNSSYSSMKDDNIIGMPLKVGDSYALFFEMYNPDESGISYDGILKLKFANSNEVVEISTTLN